jgi:outer membrane lipoprotein-sorting protein
MPPFRPSRPTGPDRPRAVSRLFSRRGFGAALGASLALAGTAARAERLSLPEISRYLNTLQSTRGSFTQINGDGSISTGTISIKRPGRVRFDYNPPEQALVMAAGGQVAIFDRKMGGAPERYPLGTTPLKFILRKNVDLQRSGIVTAHRFDGTATIVTAQDPQHPEYGSIDMVFTGAPVELRQWKMRTDGGETTVVLGEMDKTAQIPDGLFNIQNEIARQSN